MFNELIEGNYCTGIGLTFELSFSNNGANGELSSGNGGSPARSVGSTGLSTINDKTSNLHDTVGDLASDVLDAVPESSCLQITLSNSSDSHLSGGDSGSSAGSIGSAGLSSIDDESSNLHDTIGDLASDVLDAIPESSGLEL